MDLKHGQHAANRFHPRFVQNGYPRQIDELPPMQSPSLVFNLSPAFSNDQTVSKTPQKIIFHSFKQIQNELFQT